MKTFYTILFAGAFIGFPCLIWLIDDVHEGKEVFRSHEEYQEFKEAIAAPEVDLESMAVASSEPPIVVYFKAETPRGTDFAYGKMTSGRSMTSRIVLTSMIMPALLFVAILFFPSKKDSWL